MSDLTQNEILTAENARLRDAFAAVRRALVDVAGCLQRHPRGHWSVRFDAYMDGHMKAADEALARKPFDDTALLDRADHLRHAIVQITMPGYDDCAMRQVACCAIGLDNSGWPEGLATVLARWKAMDWPASNDRPRHAPIPDPREADDAPDLSDTAPLPAPSWMGAAPATTTEGG